MNSEPPGEDLIPSGDSPDDRELAQPEPSPGSMINLDSSRQLDLSGLSLEQQQQLKVKHAEAMIDVNKKAQELVADVGALNETLGTMSHHTSEVASACPEIVFVRSIS